MAPIISRSRLGSALLVAISSLLGIAAQAAEPPASMSGADLNGVQTNSRDSSTTQSSATGVSLGGTETAYINSGGASFELVAGSICNNGTTYSITGTLRLELWVFPHPFTNGSQELGYKVAESAHIAPLAQTCRNNYDSGTLARLTVPADGVYYMVMFLDMYTGSDPASDDGFVYLDFTQMSKTVTVANGVMTINQGGCTPDANTLCLNNGRFEVVTQWTDFQGNSGFGNVVPFGSDSSGIMWFFGSDNWEMLVKVLNGCPVNNHYWVFAALTTNVQYTIQVTDTLTGQFVTYSNPLGNPAAAITDTGAFATCP